MYKTLIVGRTSSGKDSLAKLLMLNHNWKFIKSYSTRKPRTPNEDTHIFITDEEMNAFKPEDIVTDTTINNIKYFCTTEQFTEADGYVVNPRALPKIFEKFPDDFFQIVYISASDDEKRRESAVKRAKAANNLSEIEIFDKRNKAENEEFSEFEAKIASNDAYGSNYDTILLINDYNEETLHQMASTIEIQRRYHENTRPIVESLIKAKLITGDETLKHVTIWDKNDDNITDTISTEALIHNISYDNPGMRKTFGDTVINYLSILNGHINPSVVPKCNALNEYDTEPNQKLFRTWLTLTTLQIAEKIKETDTLHIQTVKAVLDKDHKTNLTEYVQQQINSKFELLHNQMLSMMEKEIERIIRSVITPL